MSQETYFSGNRQTGTFNIFVPISREDLSDLAEDAATFIFGSVPPPPFTRRKKPRLHYGLFDNTRMEADEINAVLVDLDAGARDERGFGIPLTLDYARRQTLYSNQWLAFPMQPSQLAPPWDKLEALIFVYADTPAEAREVGARLGVVWD